MKKKLIKELLKTGDSFNERMIEYYIGFQETDIGIKEGIEPSILLKKIKGHKKCIIDEIIEQANWQSLYLLDDFGWLQTVPKFKHRLEAKDDKGNNFFDKLSKLQTTKEEREKIFDMLDIFAEEVEYGIDQREKDRFVENNKKYLISEQFNKGLGNIRYDGMDIALAMKKEHKDKRNETFQAYRITPYETEEFITEAIKLAELEPDIPITFTIYNGGHAIYGMVEKDKGHTNIIFIDPLADFGKWVKHNAKVAKKICEQNFVPGSFDILMNFDKIQGDGRGCTIFSINGCSELSSAKNYLPKGYSSVGDFMKRNLATKEDLKTLKGEAKETLYYTLSDAEKMGVKVCKLPPRSILSEQSISRINSRFDEDRAFSSTSPVNKKGDNAEAVLKRNTRIEKKFITLDENTSETKEIAVNKRLENKLDNLSRNIEEFMANKSWEEIESLSKKHTLSGIKEQVAKLDKNHQNKEDKNLGHHTKKINTKNPERHK